MRYNSFHNFTGIYMKIFLTAFFAIILLSGCANKNAFSQFNMGTEQEKAIENTISSKMLANNKIGGIFSAIYLNNIYKEMDKNTQKFYISIFMKESQDKIEVSLNNEEPIESKKLSNYNKYSSLLPMKNQWTKNYLVTFKSTLDSNLSLSIDSGQFSSGPLKYSINPQ